MLLKETDEHLELSEAHKQLWSEVKAQLPPDFFDDFDDTFHFTVRAVRGLHLERKPVEAIVTVLHAIKDWRSRDVLPKLLRADQVFPCQHAFHQAWPSWLHGKTKDGHIVNAERLSRVDAEQLLAIPFSDLMDMRVQYFELLERLKLRCVPRRYKIVYLMDVSGLDVSKHFGSKMRARVKDMFKIGSEVYIESIWRLYVVNVPWVFKVVWDVIKTWIPERTRVKIVLLDSNQSKNLEVLQQSGMPLSVIPKWAGGESEGELLVDVLERVRAKDGVADSECWRWANLDADGHAVQEAEGGDADGDDGRAERDSAEEGPEELEGLEPQALDDEEQGDGFSNRKEEDGPSPPAQPVVRGKGEEVVEEKEGREQEGGQDEAEAKAEAEAEEYEGEDDIVLVPREVPAVNNGESAGGESAAPEAANPHHGAHSQHEAQAVANEEPQPNSDVRLGSYLEARLQGAPHDAPKHMLKLFVAGRKRCVAARAFLHVTNLPFQTFVPAPGQSSIHGHPVLPALEDLDGHEVFGEHAIMRFVCRKYGAAARLYPPGNPNIDMALDWCQQVLRPSVRAIVSGVGAVQGSSQGARAEAAKEELSARHLPLLMTHFKGDGRPFIGGQGVCVADFSVVVALLGLADADLELPGPVDQYVDAFCALVPHTRALLANQ